MNSDFEKYTYEFNGGMYLVQPAWKLANNVALDSVELSHRDYLGYDIVVGHSDNLDVLDYTWIKKNDYIKDNLDEKVERVVLRTDNLRHTFFSGEKKVDCEIVIDCGVLELVRAVLGFLRNNSKLINNIHFKGSIGFGVYEVTHLCRTYGVTALFQSDINQSGNNIDKILGNYK